MTTKNDRKADWVDWVIVVTMFVALVVIAALMPDAPARLGLR